MKLFCQIVMVCFLIIALFHGLHQDTNGRDSKPPGGFAGAVSTVLTIVVMGFVYYGAGALSELIQK